MTTETGIFISSLSLLIIKGGKKSRTTFRSFEHSEIRSASASPEGLAQLAEVEIGNVGVANVEKIRHSLFI